jgi:O-acetyl-ADP-ribose deacetylase (regulator of RNase III)
MMDSELLLILCDESEEVTAAWEGEFGDLDDVSIITGDLCEVQADAYVSPANGFGIMDGGIDLALRDHFGFALEDRVQEAIIQHGGLRVGEAVVIETGDGDVPYLVVAPTMFTPSNVAMTSNAYDAMAAILAELERFAETNPGEITSAAIPGLCTGIGSMNPGESARQMRQAYDDHRLNRRKSRVCSGV